ncbi:MAG TPA: hypothetical protein VIL29_08980, partial [Pseudothermotoga sp.]
MNNSHYIFTALPQLDISNELNPSFDMGDGVCFQQLESRTRRILLNSCKDLGGSDDLITLLHKSESLISIEVSSPKEKLSDLEAALIQPIAQEIVKRMFNIIRMFNIGDIPQPLCYYPWFYSNKPLENIDASNIVALYPNWVSWDLPSNSNWKCDDIKPINIFSAVIILTHQKSVLRNLSKINQIKQLKLIFENKNKMDGCVKSANKYIENKTVELGQIAEVNNIHIPKELYAKWLMEGIAAAINKEVNKLSKELTETVSKNPLERAIQFFNEAFSVGITARYLLLMACMEALLSTSKQEITFQIASRASWLLNPDGYDKRKETYKKVKDLYGLRSSIIHGSKYDSTLLYENIEELLSVIRKIFFEILTKDDLFDIFFEGNCENYLNSLCLG